MAKTLYASIDGFDGIHRVSVNMSHNAATTVATIEANERTSSIGDPVNITLGYTTDSSLMFSGYVKTTEYDDATNITSVAAQDALVRAVDFFIASNTPDNSFKRTNIKAEFLVRDLLSLSGLTGYFYDATSFTFATKGPLEINLISVYDICKQIADILAWHIYAEVDGTIHFVDRKPYPMGSDSPVATIDYTKILSAKTGESADDLRNRVVVYGKGSIAATAQATSPYLPSGFYKSTVLATEFIDSQSIAQQAANYNLNLLNRLTKTVRLTIEGDSSIKARQVYTIDAPAIGLDEDFYIYSASHNWSKDGYTVDLIAVRN